MIADHPALNSGTPFVLHELMLLIKKDPFYSEVDFDIERTVIETL
jgi:hypothetical protein